MSEKLCLQWNDFKENATSAFGTLRESNDFADVTLACEDGKQFEAHKVILANSQTSSSTDLLERDQVRGSGGNDGLPLLWRNKCRSEKSGFFLHHCRGVAITRIENEQ